MQNGNFIAVLFATSNGIYSVNGKREIQTVAVEPCGFDQIVSIVKTAQGFYLISNANT